MKKLYGKRILITGASSGIGKATAEMLAAMGAIVYAGSRRAKTGIATGNIRELTLDVTDDASVKAAVDHMLECEGRIDALVCCAGIGISGAVEDISADEAMAQLDTNFCGVLRVVNAVLPTMRAQKSGHIINVGSVAGIFTIPFQSMYSCSKFALEALTEAVRMEAKPFGIKAALVEPGDTRTGFTAARAYSKATRESDAYREEFSRAIGSMVKSEMNGRSPETSARVIVKLLKRKNPPVRKVVGFEYKLLVFAKRLVPPRIVSWALRLMYCRAKEAPADIWNFERDVLK